MNPIVKFLKERRSVAIRNLLPDPIPSTDLQEIINCGIRVPDHGILAPWRIKIIQGEARRYLGENILVPEFIKKQANASEKMIEVEKNRFLRAGAILSVISRVLPHPKIPEWEMQLSCGALCQNLLNASLALGYGAQWVTEWYSESKELLQTLGGDHKTDRFAGFIYIGKTQTTPIERRRVVAEDVVEKYNSTD